MNTTTETNGWVLGASMTYPAATADALEHHVATDLAGVLYDAGVKPDDREAALAALTEAEVNPLLVSQCFERALTILRDVLQ